MATKKELQDQLDAIGAEWGSKDTVADLEEKLAAAKADAAEPEAEAEPETDGETSAWRVVSSFNDARTGEYHAPGDVIEVTEARAEEILSVAALIERA